KRKSMALILMVMLLVVASLFSLVSVNLLVSGISLSQVSLDKTKAFSYALAGKNWYFGHLKDAGSDWSGESGAYYRDRVIGEGSFDVRVNSADRNEVAFTVLARSCDDGNDGCQSAVQELSLTAVREFPGVFAVFWKEAETRDRPNPHFFQNTTLTLSTSSDGTQISGDVWFSGNALVNSPSSVRSGKIYYPQDKSVGGSGDFIAEAVDTVPEFPALSTVSYDARRSAWQDMINSVQEQSGTGGGSGGGHGGGGGGGHGRRSSGTRPGQSAQQSEDITLNDNYRITRNDGPYGEFHSNGYDIRATGSGAVLSCETFYLEGDSVLRGNDFTIKCNDFYLEDTAQIDASGFTIEVYDDFQTDGEVGITGTGVVVTGEGAILLHSRNQDQGTLSLVPDGGDLYFLSADDLIVNSGRSDTAVTLSPAEAGSRGYFFSASGNLTIQGPDTTLAQAFIFGGRTLEIENGARLSDNSLLYLDYVSSDNGNYLRITGSGTSVSGAVISRGSANTALEIDSSALISGFVYQYETQSDGVTEISGDAQINGCVFAREFGNNSLGPARITYSAADVAAASFAEGFDLFSQDGEVAAGVGSWDDD
ncbi:MAG: hypothetical protein PHV17_08915, partial [Candidatus Omnitrophica bacterium]|nr:hypothetical protein [Candidatus Omnitrophota bacterium]